jgi:hypothetical protein
MRPGVASSSVLTDLAAGTRFFGHLPRFLRRPLTVADARITVRHRLTRRETDFLALAARLVYGRPTSPYRRLLQLAGCELGDLERLVRQEGVEGALRELLRRDVYLTVDEFKGRRPAVRGTATIDVRPDLLRNPGAASHAPLQTGGSRGGATPVPVDLEFVRDRAFDALLVFAGWGGTSWRRAVWGVPGGAAMIHALEFSIMPTGLDRWFSTVNIGAPGLHPRYRWSARALRWASVLARRPVPGPVHVPPDNPGPVLEWMTRVLREGGVPHVHTFASAAAGLAVAALESGRDLAGARFTMASEPTTAARLAVVRRAGAEALPFYASLDSGPIGYGCRRPDGPDDLHALDDFQAIIQAGEDGAVRGLPARALLLSSLRGTAPYLLLNVSLGDAAILERRVCGCPLEQDGWRAHLREIRSFEKLTAGGMTFLDIDLARVLEEELPRRFGGGPTDYQLVEEESELGRPILRLLVHPRVGDVEPPRVAAAFLDAISIGSGAERVMGLAWRAADTVRVERRPPMRTSAGKILHLHVGPDGPSVATGAGSR